MRLCDLTEWLHLSGPRVFLTVKEGNRTTWSSTLTLLGGKITMSFTEIHTSADQPPSRMETPPPVTTTTHTRTVTDPALCPGILCNLSANRFWGMPSQTKTKITSVYEGKVVFFGIAVAYKWTYSLFLTDSPPKWLWPVCKQLGSELDPGEWSRFRGNTERRASASGSKYNIGCLPLWRKKCAGLL